MKRNEAVEELLALRVRKEYANRLIEAAQASGSVAFAVPGGPRKGAQATLTAWRRLARGGRDYRIEGIPGWHRRWGQNSGKARCSGKRVFWTQEAAEMAAGVTMRAYPHHDHWHIATRSDA